MRYVRRLLIALAVCMALLPVATQANPVRHRFSGLVRVTQYTQCCITASGRHVFYGEVAAPSWIPLYAHVVIPGLGRFIVLDRGAFGDNTIDVYVPYYPYPGIRDWYRGVYFTS